MVPSEVTVICAMVCRAFSISEVISICASVITDAKPSTIIRNNRIRFLIEIVLLLMLCVLNIVLAERLKFEV